MLATVVLLLHFTAPEDQALVTQMQSEMDAVFELTPVRVQIRLESSASHLGSPDDVAYVNLKHRCRPTFTPTTGALARVLAHELLHYLLQEPGHARKGIFQASFTPFELTDPAPLSVSSELLAASY